MRQRQRSGSVVLDKRIRTWNFYWWEDGKRRSKKIGTTSDYPTKASAWRAAKALRDALEDQVKSEPKILTITVRTLVEQFREEKMAKRLTTRRAYDSWLNNHILPKWGACSITELQARPVELWLKSLTMCSDVGPKPLAPKSKVHIRGLVSALWDYAMWLQLIPIQRNPMELVAVKEATKYHKPRSLTVEQFQKFVRELNQPFDIIALICVCFGLRISECLALKWSDIDWLKNKLRVERGIVRQQVDDVKTTGSEKDISIDNSLLQVLKLWKVQSQFNTQEDWIFASPVQLGALPWSYPWVWRVFQQAAAVAGVGKLGTHSMRHSYRSWLDSVGTPIAVQQKLMRHSDIRTTMNTYGEVVTDEMVQANSKVAGLALNGR
jgi:integrase